MNASEARMSSSIRSRGGTHPDADLIYDAGLTVTLPSDTIRRQIALHIADDRVEIAGDKDVASAPANLAHVLTELVHQSGWAWQGVRSEEHTSELQSLMRISYAVLCLKKKNTKSR